MMVDSRVYPKLERVPGKQNWVDYANGLPDYIERIAKHLHYEKGMSISRAIAVAVNTVKRWAHMGKVAKYGDPNHKHVTAKTAALAAKAVAEWEAKKVAGPLAMKLRHTINNSEVSEEFALDLAEEVLNDEGDLTIDLADANVAKTDTLVALMIPPAIAKKIAVDGGVPPEDLHLTLTFHGSTTPQQYQKICQDLAAWAADGGPGELKGQIGGLGQFPPSPDGQGKVPHFAPVDVPGLNALHENVKAVTSKTAPASETHGYTPHTTLTYGSNPPPPVPPTPVSFNALHVVRGNQQRVAIPLQPDTSGHARTGARRSGRGRMRTVGVKLTEDGMNQQALDLAEAAKGISDPAKREAARLAAIDLAVRPTAEQRKKYGMKDGSFPVWDKASLHSAKLLAKTPTQRRHIIRRARKLGLSKDIPPHWSMSLSELALEGIFDLASTIAPRSAQGRVSDGRRSYRHQGKWKHGFVPVDQAAKEAKAKGSPIAEKRLNRLFGGGSAPAKSNPNSVQIAEKNQPGPESATNLGDLRNTNFGVSNSVQKAGVAQHVKEGASTVPARAMQDWNAIPANLKTVRNGKRYVYAQFGGKGFVTPWVGGVQGVSGSTPDQTRVYATLAPQTAAAMTSTQLRDIILNPKSPPRVKTVARQALSDLQKRPKHG